ncbi:unnamed protein product [Rhizoctonia solani]|uniref:JmjC domain-containing protein n=1 Tax=Rhizoctonia solani TaxID=456999 RepID=A0A8H3DI36_9AGAM|nr:unnamed protein product [Rhizoctonia solani]
MIVVGHKIYMTLSAGRHDQDRPLKVNPLPSRNDMFSDLDYESDNSYELPSGNLELLSDPNWPSKTLVSLLEELDNTSEPNTQDILKCNHDVINSLRLLTLDPETVQPKLAEGREWRRLYTDVILLRCLNLLKENCSASDLERIKLTSEWERAVQLLDRAIILAGAPGEGRLELVHSCISYIQKCHLPLKPASTVSPWSSSAPPLLPLATSQVPVITPPPSLSSFPTLTQRPFILPGFASSWPATENWKSENYLVECAGRGRVVPVERGGDYRADDWGVELMPWDEFLNKIGWEEEGNDSEKLYLAQHSLFTQFPKLRADIQIPDYVYTEPGSHACYTGPPGNDEQLVINAWCGGRGANSPAHTDPYYNIYVQVVGFKSVWLAPPEASSGMYAFNSASTSPNQDQNTDEPTRDPKREGMMGNTSSIDVFALSALDTGAGTSEISYPLFYKETLPLAQSTTLKPGDALIIPPGWWHAMRGVGGGSFSVSFWF